MPLVYERDPAAIYAASFGTIKAEGAEALARLPEDARALAIRIVHSCGMVDALGDLALSPDAVAAGRAALARGCRIWVDAEMVNHGIIRRNLPAGVEVCCLLNDARVPALARARATTRSAAQVDLWDTGGAVVAIGNAPTALFRLLERLDEGAPAPALILGFPVGFVGAAESKAELERDPRGTPFVTLRGRRGGSAVAAAAVNALVSGLGA